MARVAILRLVDVSIPRACHAYRIREVYTVLALPPTAFALVPTPGAADWALSLQPGAADWNPAPAAQHSDQ